VHTMTNNMNRRINMPIGKLQIHAKHQCIVQLRMLYKSNIGIDKLFVVGLVQSYYIRMDFL